MASNQIRPILLIKSGRINEPIKIPIDPLVRDPLAYTYLTLDTASTSGTLTVKSTVTFTTSGPVADGKNLILLLGTPGNEGAEIIKSSASVAAAGTTITLASNTLFPHSAGTPVYLIPYDQVEISNAATLTGSKTVVKTLSITPDTLETLYIDTSVGALFEFARFKETINNTFSSYSDGVINTGYGPTTARKIIDNALASINKKTSDLLSDEFSFNEINNCQMETLRELKRWSFMQQFNKNLGASTLNGFFVTVPSDLDDVNTNKSVYGFRLAKQQNMNWVDKEKWNQLLQDVSYTTLKTSIALNDVSIVLQDSSDFNSSGAVLIGSNSYTYTANNKTTGTLTITASTTTNSAGVYVFQGAETGLPSFWTIFDSTFYSYPLIASSYAGLNYYSDYYKSLTQIALDTDTIVLPDPTIVQYFLAWKMLLRLANGEETEGSKQQYQNYIIRRDKLRQKETLGTSYVMKPRFNDWSRQMSGLGGDDGENKFGNFPNV